MTRKLPETNLYILKNLKKNGLIRVGTKVENQEIFVGKVRLKPDPSVLTKILKSLLNKDFFQDVSVRFPKYFSGIVTDIVISSKNFKEEFKKKKTPLEKNKSVAISSRKKTNILEKSKSVDVSSITKEKSQTFSITVYATEKRKIQIGDKVSGRHGNKGIISKILPNADMPYLPDGTPVDMLLNPLGIPSRMNVGQIYEGLLNLAAINLNERYKIQPFDEIQQYKSSQIFVYTRLNKARKKTRKNWLFDPNYLGKPMIFDGRSGKQFDQRAFIGFAYILKLIHLVKDKIHARSIGPYSLVVKQPLRGRSKSGGQRFGEMEVWAMEGFGAAYSLQELLTVKSDDLTSRSKLFNSLVKGTLLPRSNVPEAFKVFVIELQSLCFDITIFTKNYQFF